MKTHFSLLFSRSKMVIFVGCFIWISGLVVAGQRPYFYAAPTQHSSFQHVQEDVHGHFANATDADRDSQLFLTDDTRNQTLVCSHGKCRVGVITSNGGSHWRVLDPQVTTNHFAAGLALEGVLGRPSGNPIYYIAAEDSNPNGPSIPVLSGRYLRTTAPLGFKFQGKPSAKAVISIHPLFHRKGWKIRPIFLHVLSSYDANGAQYGYLISIQPSENPTQGNLTRIGRFCAGDSTLRSYSEISISCRGIGGVYTVASSASIAAHVVGRDRWIAIQFAATVPGTWNPQENTVSALCLFSLNDLNKEFDEEIKACNGNNNREAAAREPQTHLRWITGTERECHQVRRFNIQTYCTTVQSDRANHYIAGSPGKAVIGKACFEDYIQAPQLASVRTDPQVRNKISVALLYVNRSSFFFTEIWQNQASNRNVLAAAKSCSIEVLTSVPLLHQQSSPAKGKHRERFISSIVSDGSAYVLYSGNQIQTFPVGCGMHEDCEECIKAHPKLGCGWCDDICASRDLCRDLDKQWSTLGCPPVITDFSPKNGSTAGNTLLEITGKNLGSFGAEVNIGSHVCRIIQHTKEKITCRTSRVEMPIEGEVEIRVHGSSNEQHMSVWKNATHRNPFKYMVAKVDHIIPVSGWKSGGTKVSIKGTNLNLGNHQAVKISSTVCTILSVSSTEIICCTGGVEQLSSDSCPVNLYIDGSELPLVPACVKFSYYPDPVIELQGKRKTIPSGGIPIKFRTAPYFEISQASSLQLWAKVDHQSVFHRNLACNMSDIQEPDMLSCYTPSIDDSFERKSMASDLRAEIRFVDVECGSSSAGMSWAVEVRSEPVLPSPNWTGNQTAVPLNTANTAFEISITGIHLDEALTKEDYTATVDGLPCEIRGLNSTAIRCLVRSLSTEPATVRLVYVSYGNKGPIFMGNAILAKRDDLRTGVSDTVTSLKTNIIAYGLTAALCLLLPVAFLSLLLHRRCRQRTKRKRSVKVNNLEVFANNLGYGTLEQTRNVPITLEHSRLRKMIETFKNDGLVIDPMYVDQKADDKIGGGHFGVVYRGYLHVRLGRSELLRKLVAIKMLQDVSTIGNLQKLLEEGMLMKDLDHPHVMPLLGISVEDSDGTINSPRLILPFLENGDLHTYVTKTAVTIPQTLRFAMQIAEGMKYLASKQFLHRDLAARNCMLDDAMQIKICDFGLSRDIYEKGVYAPVSASQAVPIRWIAPECAFAVFTTKSDVWSFGVVVWEILTRGALPYSHIPVFQLMAYLQEGYRLEQPKNCPNILYDLMLRCWAADPSNRPCFTGLARELAQMLQERCDRHCQSHNRSIAVTVVSPVKGKVYLDVEDARGN